MLAPLALEAGFSGDVWKENGQFEIFTAQKFDAPFIP